MVRQLSFASLAARLVFALPLVLPLALVSCRKPSQPTGAAGSASPKEAPPTSSAPLPGYVLPKALAPLPFAPYRRANDLGVPAGCSLDGKVKSAKLPPGAVRFIAPPGATDELLVAIDEDGDGAVDSGGIVNADGALGPRLPWARLEEPPVVAKSAAGYLVFAAEDAGAGMRQAVFFRESGKVERLAVGDHLDVLDANCAGSTCAVLTTLASRSAAPGATLFLGIPRGPASAYTRTDVPGGEHDLRPFSVMHVGDQTASVALATGTRTAAFRIAKSAATPLGEVDSPFGAYDVVEGATPIAVAPGESIEDRCQKDGFPVKLLRPGKEPIEVDGQVPPTSVITRELGTGFMVAWLSPVSCKHDGHDFVRAFLVSRDGTPASSTMAISAAEGFALGSAGDHVNLVLSIDHELVWMKAICRVPGA